jgi:hypothetical protein
MIVLAGCRARTPLAPTPQIEGAWSGTISHRVAVHGRATLAIAQSGAAVTGTWSADFDGATFDARGSIGGTVTATSLSLFLTPDVPHDCGSGETLTGTLALTASVRGDRLTGSYLGFACEGVESGEMDLMRQR